MSGEGRERLKLAGNEWRKLRRHVGAVNGRHTGLTSLSRARARKCNTTERIKLQACGDGP